MILLNVLIFLKYGMLRKHNHMVKAKIINVHGKRAMYRKPYSTTSALCYLVIPPTCVRGIYARWFRSLFPRETLYEDTKDWKVGIKINKQFYLCEGEFNLQSHRSDRPVKNCIRSWLFDIDYTFFVIMDNDLDYSIGPESYLYLGKSEFFAVSEYIGEKEVEYIDSVSDFYSRCVLNADETEIDFEKIDSTSGIYQRRIPIEGTWLSYYKKNVNAVFTSGKDSIPFSKAKNLVKIGDDYMHLF